MISWSLMAGHTIAQTVLCSLLEHAANNVLRIFSMIDKCFMTHLYSYTRHFMSVVGGNSYGYLTVLRYYTYSSVGIVMGYRLDGRSSIPGSGMRSFSTPQYPDRLKGPPRFLFSGYRGLFPRWWSGLGMELYTHLHLVHIYIYYFTANGF
jgi:hypothetical protein